MKVTIVNVDKFVSVDGVGYSPLDFSIPENVVVVQWSGTQGEIEFKEQNGVKPANQVITSLDAFNSAYEAWVETNNIVLNPPPLTEEQLKEQCKNTAKQLLALSDWSVLPDVNLSNQQDFQNYRSVLRQLVVVPVVDPIYPVEPEPVWA